MKIFLLLSLVHNFITRYQRHLVSPPSCFRLFSASRLEKNNKTIMNTTLSYVGKITKTEPIPNADFVQLVTIDCKDGGIWKGIVKKNEDFGPEGLCTAFLHDAIVPEREELEFMRQYKWRVAMRKFKGVPSECVIIPALTNDEHGTALDNILGVKKHYKVIPFYHPINSKLSPSKHFPSFIPITDEVNFQRSPELLERMLGTPCVVSLKYDGTSTTAYRYEDHFGVCSRNLELNDDGDKYNVYWATAKKYNLQDNLPEGVAIQWETCGPKINKNNHHLTDFEAFLFTAIDIRNREYFSYDELKDLATQLNMPLAKALREGPLESVDGDYLRNLSETMAVDPYGKSLEGIVVRSVERFPINYKRSFKVLNLAYKHT